MGAALGQESPHVPRPQAEVVTLARQIIEATPERIKQEAPGGPPGVLGAAGGTLGTTGTPGPAGPAGLGAAMAWLATYLESVDRPPAPPHRYSGVGGCPGAPSDPWGGVTHIQQHLGDTPGDPIAWDIQCPVGRDFTSCDTAVSPWWGFPTSCRTPVSSGGSPGSWDTAVFSQGHP